MIELSEEQRQSLTQGREVSVSDSETKQEYILVLAAVYRRLKNLIYDDREWTQEEQMRLLAESGKRAGWDNPEMDVYDNYDENSKKLCP